MRRAALYLARLVTLTGALSNAQNGASLVARDDDRSLAGCYPPSSGGSGPKAPCVSLDNLGWMCEPNGTTPIALEAQAQCICKGSYFADYSACQDCLLAHGARSPADNAFFASVIASVSRSYCSGTPSAKFQSVFESIAAGLPRPTGGDTASSDRAGGRTEISVYATITYSQGPGQITGSATAATMRPSAASSVSASGSNSAPGSGVVNGGSNTRAGGPSSAAATTTTTSSPNGAMPTTAIRGVALGVAAGVIMVGL